MEGVLWKWTNFWNGWQMRWFVLNDGILSYYMSADEVNQCCKGSMKVSAVEITVSNVDNTRMDLSIPGEKNMYLRASTSQERQQWIVALGTSKACLTNNNRNSRKDSISHSGSPDIFKMKKSELKLYCDLLMQQVHGIKSAASEENGPNINKLAEESALLTATCDTFIKTLEDCMHLSNSILAVGDHGIKDNVTRPPISVMRANSK